jgi:hypothetical protein
LSFQFSMGRVIAQYRFSLRSQEGMKVVAQASEGVKKSVIRTLAFRIFKWFRCG